MPKDGRCSAAPSSKSQIFRPLANNSLQVTSMGFIGGIGLHNWRQWWHTCSSQFCNEHPWPTVIDLRNISCHIGPTHARVPCAIGLPLAHPVKQEVDAQCDKLHSHALRSTVTSRHILSTCLTDNDAVYHTERSHLFCRAKLTVTASTLAAMINAYRSKFYKFRSKFCGEVVLGDTDGRPALSIAISCLHCAQQQLAARSNDMGQTDGHPTVT